MKDTLIVYFLVSQVISPGQEKSLDKYMIGYWKTHLKEPDEFQKASIFAKQQREKNEEQTNPISNRLGGTITTRPTTQQQTNRPYSAAIRPKVRTNVLDQFMKKKILI
jgi:hypothetical protein